MGLPVSQVSVVRSWETITKNATNSVVAGDNRLACASVIYVSMCVCLRQ